MLRLFKKNSQIDAIAALDAVQSAVYAYLKPYGFRKHGRTLHRFVSGDISQVIHFQCGRPAKTFCVNVGIRIPECAERSFPPQTIKNYYHEYECTMRSRLGAVRGKEETWYDLRKDTHGISHRILRELEQTVLPVFDLLSSRDAILLHRRDYPSFDVFDGGILLDDCMIYGRMGEREKAKEAFDAYYRQAVAEYEDKTKNGERYYLKKGERIVYMGQDITARKNGYVTLYGADHSHIDYLDKLATELGLK